MTIEVKVSTVINEVVKHSQ